MAQVLAIACQKFGFALSDAYHAPLVMINQALAIYYAENRIPFTFPASKPKHLMKV